MKKKLSLIVLACALTLGVSGCGSEADTTTSNEKESMVAYSEAIVSSFSQTPDEVFDQYEELSLIHIYCLLAFSHSIAAILRGAGKTMVSMIIMMMCWCVIRVSFLSVMIPLTHSIQAVYWVYPLTWSLSSLAFFWYYKKAKWI